MSDIKKDNTGLSLNQEDSNFRSFIYDFIKNDHYTFVVQKTEKLSSALYVVTSHMSATEPLRTRLRTCALDLVSRATDPAGPQGAFHDAFGSQCLEISTMVKLAERAGLISPMNAKVLCHEYGQLASFVRDHKDKLLEAQVDVGAKRPTLQSLAAGSMNMSDTGRIKDKETTNGKRHSQRQDQILDLLSKKDKITVREASEAIIGCSEKTIQREIMSLVDEGVLIKEGERRWSTYRKTPVV